VEIAQRVAADLVGQVGRVGAAPPGLLAGMHLEQLSAVAELDLTASWPSSTSAI
jgi:hypothetical protein